MKPIRVLIVAAALLTIGFAVTGCGSGNSRSSGSDGHSHSH